MCIRDRFRIVFVLTQTAEDTRCILLCRLYNRFKIRAVNICRAFLQDFRNDGIIKACVVYLHHFLADEKRALVSAVFLGKHPLRVGLLINDTKQVHSAVPNIAEHINAREARQVIDNGCEPLRVHLSLIHI